MSFQSWTLHIEIPDLHNTQYEISQIPSQLPNHFKISETWILNFWCLYLTDYLAAFPNQKYIHIGICTNSAHEGHLFNQKDADVQKLASVSKQNFIIGSDYNFRLFGSNFISPVSSGDSILCHRHWILARHFIAAAPRFMTWAASHELIKAEGH